MQFDVIVMLIFLATLPQTLNVIFSMEIALRHHRFCDFKYSNLEWEWSNIGNDKVYNDNVDLKWCISEKVMVDLFNKHIQGSRYLEFRNLIMNE